MDARLIESAIDPANPVFKDRGIYAITPKGLHILERFITRNGIAADHLVKVFTSQPICMRLLHLERRLHDDDIIVTKPVLEGVFRRFVGHKHPNYIVDPAEATRALQQGSLRIFVETVAKPVTGFDRANGVEMQDIVERIPGKSSTSLAIIKHVFSSAGAIDWLCDFSTCCCRDEAAEILAHFVRFKFITLAVDRSRGDGLPIQGPAKGQVEAEFRWGPKVTYRITDEGRRLAAWNSLNANGKAEFNGSKTKLSTDSGDAESRGSNGGMYSSGSPHGSTQTLNNASTGGNASTTIGGEWTVAGGVGVGNALDAVFNKMSFKDVFDLDLLSSDYSKWAGGEGGQHSSTTRLRAILEDIRLRAYFRDFLKNNYCEENLGFWLDVQDFRRRFATTSSASSSTLPGSSNSDDKKGSNSATSSSPHTAGHHQSNPSTAKKPLLRGIASLGGFGSSNNSNNNSAASTAMESHQHDINIAAVNIYRTYLAPQSPSELNIDHNLRADVVNFIQKCAEEAGIPATALAAPMTTLLPGAGSAANLLPPTSIPSPSTSPDLNSATDTPSLAATAAAAAAAEKQIILPLRATQVQTLLRYYEKIQDHIFRLLATDQVPRFIRTPEFMQLLKAASGQVRKHSVNGLFVLALNKGDGRADLALVLSDFIGNKGVIALANG